MLNGEEFETLTAAFLEAKGLQIVERQFRCRRGEIDLIAMDGSSLVFVEVRARRSMSHGGAGASVDRKKQCKISRCAAYFLQLHPEWRSLPCRFDVVAWEPHRDTGAMTPRWIRGAFNG